MVQRKRNALLEAGREVAGEISFPLRPGTHLSLTPKAPASRCSSSRGLVITAAPRGNGIFSFAVITATYAQQRDRVEQEKRG